MRVAARFSMGDSASEGQDRTERVERISFAEDGMAVELVPLEAIRDAEASVKARYGDGGVSDVLADGMAGSREEDDLRLASLQETIAARMRKRGVASVQAERIVLTNGLEQSLEWIVRELTVSGDTVLVERPTGLAGLSVLARCGAQVVGVGCDEQGLLVEELERLLEGVAEGKNESESESESTAAKKPRLLYAAPTYGDPTGRLWSVERRQAVVALCQAHGVIIVEDDTCGELKFHADAADPPTLYELAGEAGGVIYVNSFEHVIVPSLRVGWMAGGRSELARFGVRDDDTRSNVIDQLVLAELLRHIDLDAHVRRVADIYRERMYAMQRQLRIHQLPVVKWTEPEGGRSLWLTLPDELDAEALRRLTRMMGVEITPGSRLYANEPQRNAVRLYFTNCSMDEIERGVEILAEAIRGFVARWRDD